MYQTENIFNRTPMIKNDTIQKLEVFIDMKYFVHKNKKL